MNAYKIESQKMKESKKVSDPKELLKFRLVAGLLNIISKMETQEVLTMTGLHKADLSRLRSSNIKRFSIDRIVGILNSLGYSAKISIVEIEKAS